MVQVDLRRFPRWVDDALKSLPKIMGEYHLADIDRIRRFMYTNYGIEVLALRDDKLGVVHMREQDYILFSLKWS